jgi:hypothetical protein
VIKARAVRRGVVAFVGAGALAIGLSPAAFGGFPTFPGFSDVTVILVNSKHTIFTDLHNTKHTVGNNVCNTAGLGETTREIANAGHLFDVCSPFTDDVVHAP